MYDLLNAALKAGEIMLKNGSETYRVQYTIEMLLADETILSKDIVVIGTAIVATIQFKDAPPLTMSRSIDRRKNNLQKLSLVTTIAEDYINGKVTLNTLIEKLDTIDNSTTYPSWLKIIATGLAAAFFTFGYGSSLQGVLSIFLISLIPAFFIQLALKKNMAFFLSNILAGAIVAFLTLVVLQFYPLLQFDKMIASIIIIMTPGITAVTAIRDIVNGDFITGASRGIEALTLAAGLSIGVGFVFGLYVFITGGVIWKF